jgi:hypothetical protein
MYQSNNLPKTQHRQRLSNIGINQMADTGAAPDIHIGFNSNTNNNGGLQIGNSSGFGSALGIQ